MQTNSKDKLAYICRKFRLPGELILHRWIPTGHINEAYYVALYDGKEVRQYLAQNTWNTAFGVEYNKLAGSVAARAAELDQIIN